MWPDLIEMGYQVIVSHGNGPQVGFIMRRSEIAHKAVGLHPVPMVNCVADTQGSIGYQIQQSLFNELESRGLPAGCVSLITQVMVDPADPGFVDPSKPVGSFFNEAEAEEVRRDFPPLGAQRGRRAGLAAGGAFTPAHRDSGAAHHPRTAVSGGFHLVGGGRRRHPGDAGAGRASGGGRGDRQRPPPSSLLAHQLGADLMIISTAVERIALNYGKPNQTDIGHMTAKQTR